MTRSAKEIKGKIVISGLTNFEEKVYPISITRKEMNNANIEKKIEVIALTRKKESIKIKGVLENEKKTEKFGNADLKITIINDDKKEILEKTIITDKNGNYELEVKDLLKKGEKYKIEIATSDDKLIK